MGCEMSNMNPSPEWIKENVLDIIDDYEKNGYPCSVCEMYNKNPPRAVVEIKMTHYNGHQQYYELCFNCLHSINERGCTKNYKVYRWLTTKIL